MTTKRKKNIYRPDQTGTHEVVYKKNKAYILKSEEYCAICGAMVDKSLKFPHPLSASIDHIIAVANGGHPSSLDNLQLTHLICNQLKGTKATIEANKGNVEKEKVISNRVLPHSLDWLKYKHT